MATKSISQLNSASAMAFGDLLEIAEPDAQSVSGYASKKISIGSQLAPYIQETVQNANLNTTDKTLVGAINEVDSEGVKWSENNVLGAKNIIPFPYETKSNPSLNNLDVKINADGSIKINGTASAITRIYLYGTGGNGGLKLNIFKNMRATMQYSTGQFNSNCYIYAQTYTADYSEHDNLNDVDGTGIVINDKPLVRLAIYIPSGSQISNLTVYPMVTVEGVQDKTWAQNSLSNIVLTAKKANYSNLADVETDDNTTKAYSVGDYMIWKGGFYKVTTAISAGGAITEGTNVTATTIGAELTALFAALSS